MAREEDYIELKKRYESEARACRRITNADLICKDCIYALDDSVILGNTSRCKRYSWKPSTVKAGRDCEYYQSSK